MSLLLAPVDRSPKLLARMHLHAVLPAFPELLKHSTEARKTIGERSFRMRFSCRDLYADLCFIKGRCRYVQRPSGTPTIHLRYLSFRQLNRAFAGGSRSFALPLLNPLAIPRLIVFSNLSSQLKGILEISGESGSAEQLLNLRLSLHIALAATAILIESETFSRTLLGGPEEWSVRIRVAYSDLSYWIGRKNGQTVWGRNPTAPAKAELQFSSADLAQKGLEGILDNMSAMNEGSLRISGHLPLVERLSQVLERVPLYLQPSSPL